MPECIKKELRALLSTDECTTLRQHILGASCSQYIEKTMAQARKFFLCGLTMLCQMVIYASGSYVQVKFYYKNNSQGTGQSWNAYTAKDGSCSPCTNLVRDEF